MTVKRYDMSGFGDGMVESEEGAFYYMDDYHALLSLNAEMLEALEKCRTELAGYEHEITGESYNSPILNSIIDKARSQS